MSTSIRRAQLESPFLDQEILPWTTDRRATETLNGVERDGALDDLEEPNASHDELLAETEAPLVESETWTGSTDQIAFRNSVLAAHIARSHARRGAPLPDLGPGDLAVVPGSTIRTRPATAMAAGLMLSVAFADLTAAQQAGDVDARRTLGLTVNSGYRSSAHQRSIWLDYFARKYYNRSRTAREALANGRHSQQAVNYMLRPIASGGFGLAGRIAAPGYSNHQSGIALDFRQIRTSGHDVPNESDAASRQRWRDTWFHRWLRTNAATYGFVPIATEEWHWEYRGRPATAPTPPPASTRTVGGSREFETADADRARAPRHDYEQFTREDDDLAFEEAEGAAADEPHELDDEFDSQDVEATGLDRETGLDYESGAGASRADRIAANLQQQAAVIPESVRINGLDQGLKNENEFVDAVYWQLHPDRVRQKIARSDPAYARLRRDWLDARDLLIRPMFGAFRSGVDLRGNPLPVSQLAPGAVPTTPEIVRICQLYGEEMAARCRTTGRSAPDRCELQRIRAEAACLERILRRKTRVFHLEREVTDAPEPSFEATDAPAPEHSRESIRDVAPTLADLTDRVLFGEVWERPGLSKRDRSLVTVATLVALNRIEQLPTHLTRALANGVTKTELVELVTHLAFYSGWPTAVSAALRINALR